MITLAIQKSGRLSDHTLQLLKECGIDLSNGGPNRLQAIADNFPLQILYLRDDDIPACITDGVADAGIVGENVVAEKEQPMQVLEPLGFARCRLAIAVPQSSEYQQLSDLMGCKIATSYPNILNKYLAKHNVKAEIHPISGSVEIAPQIGLADAVFDIVGTGSTLISNRLREIESVMPSQALLIAAPELPAEKQQILEKFCFRIRAVKQARHNKYILLNAPNESIEAICKILPGMKSPTIIPLKESGWSSLHSVIQEDDFWEVIENLRSAGAEGILVVPIEKMIV